MSHDQEIRNQIDLISRDNDRLKRTIDALTKEARKALVGTGMWNQEFHGNEIVGMIAIYMATRHALAQKEAGLHLALEFIGTVEDHEIIGPSAIKALESINQVLVGETIQESIIKKH